MTFLKQRQLYDDISWTPMIFFQLECLLMQFLDFSHYYFVSNFCLLLAGKVFYPRSQINTDGIHSTVLLPPSLKHYISNYTHGNLIRLPTRPESYTLRAPSILSLMAHGHIHLSYNSILSQKRPFLVFKFYLKNTIQLLFHLLSHFKRLQSYLI